MNKENKAGVLKAAKDVFDKKSHATCLALRYVRTGYPYPDHEYAAFYDKPWMRDWELDLLCPKDRELRLWRVMLLLWFREVGLEGIE